MSMIYCQGCGFLIDSDEDPGCFDEKAIRVLCEICRDEQDEINENNN